jgi:hypothetical protein
MKLLFTVTVAAGLTVSAASVQNYMTLEGQGAEKLFRQSRRALGGEEAVGQITSLLMKGTSRVSGGDGGPPDRSIEIRYLFPDQYVRIESAGPWSKRSGFSGSTLLTEIRDGAKIDKPPAQMTEALLRAEKARLARLLLGIASLTTPEVWLTVRQPPGETDFAANASALKILQASAVKDGFAALVFYDGPGVPLRVEYEAGARRITITFADRKKAGSLLLPHSITTLLDGQPVEAMTFSEITVNPKLTKSDFGG